MPKEVIEQRQPFRSWPKNTLTFLRVSQGLIIITICFKSSWPRINWLNSRRPWTTFFFLRPPPLVLKLWSTPTLALCFVITQTWQKILSRDPILPLWTRQTKAPRLLSPLTTSSTLLSSSTKHGILVTAVCRTNYSLEIRFLNWCYLFIGSVPLNSVWRMVFVRTRSQYRFLQSCNFTLK